MVAANKEKFKVLEEDAGTRLDVYLAYKLPEFSRSWIKKLIENGNAKVGGKKAKASQKIKTGNAVSFLAEMPPEISLEPDPTLDSKIDIVFENKNFLVIQKPSGIVVHPSSSTPKGTVVNWLLYKYPRIKSVGDMADSPDKINLRPGIVHRLDKETSGLMVIAKNQRNFEWFKEQFKDRSVTKKYLVLAAGLIEKDGGEIKYPIGRSRNDPTKQVAYKTKSNTPPYAKEAITYWQVIKRFPDYTYLEVAPKTGRMHQIRVHLKAIGHPVAGDKKYSDASTRQPKHLGRMFLHASYLGFKAANGEKFSFNSPLPQDLSNALKNLPFMVD